MSRVYDKGEGRWWGSLSGNESGWWVTNKWNKKKTSQWGISGEPFPEYGRGGAREGPQEGEGKLEKRNDKKKKKKTYKKGKSQVRADPEKVLTFKVPTQEPSTCKKGNPNKPRDKTGQDRYFYRFLRS